LVQNQSVSKVASKWGYTAIHPSGKIAAYSINKVHAFFHSAGLEVRDVVDLDSAIVYYDLQKQTVKSVPDLRDIQRLETYPSWSPDGRNLFFCSAPIPWTDRTTVPPRGFDQVRYELRRIAYDPDTDTWGRAETILSTETTGKSILLPRISPDGKLLVFCMCQYGCFPIYQPSSDLYVMDLQTGNYRPMECNSDFSESWHSFSSNSRWLAFSSKRQGGLFTRTYFAYLEPDGTTRKSFVLPQENPAYYDECIQCFSVPELLTGPVTVSERKLASAVSGKEAIQTSLPITTATPRATSSPQSKKPVERE
jgi:Tol biopolymer transport system component